SELVRSANAERRRKHDEQAFLTPRSTLTIEAAECFGGMPPAPPPMQSHCTINMNIAALSSRLTLDEHGIWMSAKSSSVSYPKDGHHACLPLDGCSYWFKRRND